ncbi:MAG: hypothetical protein H0X44_04305, partial [Acidobacteria bacterium]|nr:hypothetical protein [Acidobacteriota bacterium]
MRGVLVEAGNGRQSIGDQLHDIEHVERAVHPEPDHVTVETHAEGNNNTFVRPLRGRVSVPGDKSISHRYALLAALAAGRSRIEGLAPGEDVRSTLSCLETLGARITFSNAHTVEVDPHPAGLSRPGRALDAGNSGTTMRLLAGILAGHAFSSTLVGDASLSGRPMERVAAPLRAMGATVTTTEGRAPMTIAGGALRAIDYASPVASAQVKSAVLLAGLFADGRTSVSEPSPTRDHTERAFRAFGVSVEARPGFAAVEGGQRLH